MFGRQIFMGCSAAIAALAVVHHALAQTPRIAAQGYPERPIRLIVPFPPGGGNDITSRVIALKVTQEWGRPMVVDNRAGANGTIGINLVAKSSPDGYTLAMISSSSPINFALYKNLPYDLLRDFTPITLATSQPYIVIVHPLVPAKSIKELIAFAKAKPGTISCGSSGTGGISHLAMELLNMIAGTTVIHVPYKGGAPALNDVIAGQIQMLFSTILQSQAYIKAGRVRPLAVTTAKRAIALPELPTMQEAGVPGYEVAGWYGFVAPAATPRAIITKLNVQIAQILHTQDLKDRMSVEGSEPIGSTPEQFSALISSDIAKWKKVIRETNIRIE